MINNLYSCLYIYFMYNNNERYIGLQSRDAQHFKLRPHKNAYGWISLIRSCLVCLLNATLNN